MWRIKKRSPWTFQLEFLFELCFFSQNFVIEADGIGILLEKQLAIGILIWTWFWFSLLKLKSKMLMNLFCHFSTFPVRIPFGVASGIEIPEELWNHMIYLIRILEELLEETVSTIFQFRIDWIDYFSFFVANTWEGKVMFIFIFFKSTEMTKSGNQ